MKELVLEGFRMNKKYELLRDDSIIENNTELYRIRALRSFGDVKKGDLGGYIESESNLSHEGNCWVYDDAYIYKGLRVSGEAQVFKDYKVLGGHITNEEGWFFCSPNGICRAYDENGDEFVYRIIDGEN